MARLPKVEIPELDYKLKDGSDDLFNNRKLKNLVVENVSVSTNYIVRLLPTSGHEWILINSFTFFRLQGKQRISEVAPSPGGFSTARLLGWNKGEKNTGLWTLSFSFGICLSGGTRGVLFLYCS